MPNKQLIHITLMGSYRWGLGNHMALAIRFNGFKGLGVFGFRARHGSHSVGPSFADSAKV